MTWLSAYVRAYGLIKCVGLVFGFIAFAIAWALTDDWLLRGSTTVIFVCWALQLPTSKDLRDQADN